MLLSVISVTPGTGGTVALVGTTITFTPTAEFEGEASFSYTVSDGSGAANAETTGTVTVTVTTHPKLWVGQKRPWMDELHRLDGREGWTVLDPGSGWEDALGAAAVSVSDHTSLVGVFSLLRRPMVFARVPDGLVGDGTVVQSFYEHCPVISDWETLGKVIESAVADGAPPAALAAVDEILSYPGEAADRTVAVARRLLAEP